MRVQTRSIASIAAEWDRLADEVGASPFLRPGWTIAWWHAFGRGSIRALVVHGGGERLTGVVPLVRAGSALRSPTNSETPLFGFLAADRDDARRMARALVGTDVRRLDLSLISSEDIWFQDLRAEAHARGFRTITRPVLLSAFVSTHGPWSGYEATLSAKFRSEIRRRTRRLRELGDLTLDVSDGSQHLERLLSEGFRVERSGWKGAYGTAMDSNPHRQKFYQEVARWAGERGWLKLAFLRLDERPIAFDLCLEASGVHYLLKTGFDHRYHRFGPGVILRSMMLQRAFSGSIDTYEFLGTIVGANNRWKLDWTDRFHQRVRFQAFAPSLAGSLGWPAFKYGPVVSERAREFAGRTLGTSGRDLVKRGRRMLRGVLPR